MCPRGGSEPELAGRPSDPAAPGLRYGSYAMFMA